MEINTGHLGNSYVAYVYAKFGPINPNGADREVKSKKVESRGKKKDIMVTGFSRRAAGAF